MGGAEQLDAMIAKIQRIPRIAREAAPEAADAVRKAVLETVAAGTDTEGNPWAPRKAGGGRPLENAAGAVRVAAVGTRIFVRLAGPEARHHLGRARGGTVRPIIPRRLTPRIAEAIRKVLVRRFRAAIEGEG